MFGLDFSMAASFKNLSPQRCDTMKRPREWRHLELPNGTPDEKTFARIDPIELAACLGRRLDEAREAG
ncbi:MAG: transposase family protein [Spirochaetaceae bacterium]|nr:transposase family protein [Spirochaetaceae bacterium]